MDRSPQAAEFNYRNECRHDQPREATVLFTHTKKLLFRTQMSNISPFSFSFKIIPDIFLTTPVLKKVDYCVKHNKNKTQ